LGKALEGLSTTDAAIVVFGSLARNEWTKSDVDWTLLIDGQADPEHLGLAQKVAQRLESEGFVPPGTSGIFGSMTFSHDLVQKIGGREDTNENTTRRVLLIQEPKTFGKDDAYTRTLKHIFSRYLKDDRGAALWESSVKSAPGAFERYRPILEDCNSRLCGEAARPSGARMGVEKCETQNVTEAHFRNGHVELFLLRVTKG